MGVTKVMPILLRRHSPDVAGRRRVWPDVAFSCTDSGWTWPGVAQYLPTLAPRLAPRNLVSFANVRTYRTQYRPEIGLTTQRDGRIRENARRPAVRREWHGSRTLLSFGAELDDRCGCGCWTVHRPA